MPLQVRARDGTIHEVPGNCSLEFVDEFKRLAVAVTQSPAGQVMILTPGDPLFDAYCNLTKSQKSRVHIHEDLVTQPK